LKKIIIKVLNYFMVAKIPEMFYGGNR